MVLRAALKGKLGWTLAASGLVLVGATVLRADDPPRGLGRIFRLGQSSRSTNSSSSSAGSGSGMPSRSSQPAESFPYGPLPSTSPSARPAASGTSMNLSSVPTPSVGGSRIAPQPRVSRAATEADPLVSRISIGRSDDGKQFCMFLQVFADGTVLDSEGVHRLGPDVMRGLMHTLQAADYSRLRGYCGGPPTDFIEQCHVVVYDRYLGRLRANSFSYSGNPKGCDPSVKALQDALDAVQTKVSGPPMTSPSTGAPPAAASPIAPPAPTADAPTIPLTPID